ncbi:MAG: diacylglycerol kinase family protein, partial [Coriobacteriia bacterium]|nr:diacylglycerol kinase family protein [Coriobacteriia bacterium]
MRVLVVVNTHSGGGDAGIYDYVRALGAHGIEIVFRSAEPGASYAELVSDATSFDAIVAAGGDGTASAVCYASRNTGVPVLVYPAGTANLLALNLGL